MLRRAFVAVTSAGLLGSQTGANPGFEVASIRRYTSEAPARQGTEDGPPPPPPPPVLRPSPGGLSIENATLKYCLVWAYGVRNSQVSGPSWINELHYDINAKTSAPTQVGELKRMLQMLLTERFRLALQRDNKERLVLGIVLASKGSKLAPSKPGTDASQQFTPISGGSLRIEAKNTGFEFLEQILSFPVWNPVVNVTGIAGGFDFTFVTFPKKEKGLQTRPLLEKSASGPQNRLLR